MVCAYCLEGFDPKRSDQRYCSTRCRVAAHRQAEKQPIEEARAAFKYYRTLNTSRGGGRRKFSPAVERLAVACNALRLSAGNIETSISAHEQDGTLNYRAIVEVAGAAEVEKWLARLDADRRTLDRIQAGLRAAIRAKDR